MDGKNPAIGKFALGHVQMILHSISEHQENHDGELPERIEMHPVVMNGFLNELLRHYPRYFEDYTDEGHFLGIPIITSEKFEQPRLITHQGKIQYL